MGVDGEAERRGRRGIRMSEYPEKSVADEDVGFGGEVREEEESVGEEIEGVARVDEGRGDGGVLVVGGEDDVGVELAESGDGGDGVEQAEECLCAGSVGHFFGELSWRELVDFGVGGNARVAGSSLKSSISGGRRRRCCTHWRLPTHHKGAGALHIPRRPTCASIPEGG